jgi:hypothetical protein
MSIADYYIFVASYGWPHKADAKAHAKRFEDGIFKWNKTTSQWDVYRPEYAKI